LRRIRSIAAASCFLRRGAIAKGGRKEGRKLEYILKISNGVVVQGKMTVSCYFAAFFGGGAAKKAEIG
jgi:hypothetical protein